MGDTWSPLFYQSSALFNDIVSTAELFSRHCDWPTLEDYNRIFNSLHGAMTSLSGQSLVFVPQGGKPQTLQEYYEVRIYLSGEIQTRINNWHDFFQVIIWCNYNNTKSIINKMHYQALSDRYYVDGHNSKRSATENSLTLFDECGAIIVSSNPALLQQVKDFDWQGLFLTNRDCFDRNIKCFIFGHALYEKCLNPYLGMTAHCICLLVEADFFSLQLAQQKKVVDQLSCEYFKQHGELSPRELNPFPLLGVPGWDVRNTDPVFYQNKDYFRSARKKDISQNPQIATQQDSTT